MRHVLQCGYWCQYGPMDYTRQYKVEVQNMFAHVLLEKKNQHLNNKQYKGCKNLWKWHKRTQHQNHKLGRKEGHRLFQISMRTILIKIFRIRLGCKMHRPSSFRHKPSSRHLRSQRGKLGLVRSMLGCPSREDVNVILLPNNYF
jgi:hypothetical protein